MIDRSLTGNQVESVQEEHVADVYPRESSDSSL